MRYNHDSIDKGLTLRCTAGRTSCSKAVKLARRNYFWCTPPQETLIIQACCRKKGATGKLYTALCQCLDHMTLRLCSNSWRMVGAREWQALEKERGWRKKGAGEGKGLEKESGWRKKVAGERKWLEKESGQRRKGARERKERPRRDRKRNLGLEKESERLPFSSACHLPRRAPGKE